MSDLGIAFEKFKPYFLMVLLQFGAAGMYIITLATLNHGMNRYVLIVYRNAIAALVLAPFALVLERLINYSITDFINYKYCTWMINCMQLLINY